MYDIHKTLVILCLYMDPIPMILHYVYAETSSIQSTSDPGHSRRMILKQELDHVKQLVHYSGTYDTGIQT